MKYFLKKLLLCFMLLMIFQSIQFIVGIIFNMLLLWCLRVFATKRHCCIVLFAVLLLLATLLKCLSVKIILFLLFNDFFSFWILYYCLCTFKFICFDFATITLSCQMHWWLYLFFLFSKILVIDTFLLKVHILAKGPNSSYSQVVVLSENGKPTWKSKQKIWSTHIIFIVFTNFT